MLFNKIPLTDCFWITFFLFSLFFDSKIDCLAMKEVLLPGGVFLIPDPDVKTLPNSLELLYTKPVSRRCPVKKVFLKIRKFTGKHLCQSLLVS